jgi:hypothetical protein
MGLHAQQKSDTLDLNEAVKQIMGSKDPEKQGSGTSILPAIGYNPTFGLMLGATLTGGKTLGNPATTTLSTGTFTGFITTKGIINVQLRHNVFTENKSQKSAAKCIARRRRGRMNCGSISIKLSRQDMSTKVKVVRIVLARHLALPASAT